MDNMRNQILQGNCLEILRTLEANSLDSCVVDPPYGLGEVKDIAGLLMAWMNDTDDKAYTGKSGFMNKEWDSSVPGPRYWKEVLRVLKPGAHILAFAGTRTYDLLVIALRLAGFEIRDQIDWLYGSGFPKSMDVSKQIDKHLKAEREVVEVTPAKNSMGRYQESSKEQGARKYTKGLSEQLNIEKYGGIPITAPATPEAERYAGFGTNLKPAHEPICLARKPLAESSIAANVLEWGVGAINIAATRVGVSQQQNNPAHVAHDSADVAALASWLGIDQYDDGCLPSLETLCDLLRRVSSVLHSYSTAYTSPSHSESDQGDRLPSPALCELLQDYLYPNGVWCGLDLKEVLSFQGDCPACSHFCDEHVHIVQEASQVSVASLADALSCMSLGLSELQRNHDLCICHPSNSGVLRQVWSLTCSLTDFSYSTTYSNRLSTGENLMRPARRGKGVTGNWANYSQEPGMYGTPDGQGRWPANLLLSHSVWCVPNGVKRVRTSTHSVGKLPRSYTTDNGFFRGGSGHVPHDYLDSEGMEQVEDWLCTEDCPVRLLDEQSGHSVSKAGNRGRPMTSKGSHEGWKRPSHEHYTDGYSSISDEGGASRYFMRFAYVPKASRAERNRGCEGLPEKEMGKNQASFDGGKILTGSGNERSNQATNNHPCVKPINLVRYLVRMITPPGGIVLDCFGGSGTTALACIAEGFDYLIIEQEQSYIEIAEARIQHALTEVA